MLTKSAGQVAKGECGKILMPTMVAPRFPQCHWDSGDPEGVFRIPYAFDKTWAEVVCAQGAQSE